jgi:hypothetical protein
MLLSTTTTDLNVRYSPAFILEAPLVQFRVLTKKEEFRLGSIIQTKFKRHIFFAGQLKLCAWMARQPYMADGPIYAATTSMTPDIFR